MLTDLARARARLLAPLALALTMGLQTLPALAQAPSPAAVAAPLSAVAPAASASASAPKAALDSRLQELKAELVALNRDLRVLEEDLLFPPGTQLAVFLSLEVGKPFELEAVQLLLDDKLVASHLYTPLELQALQRGGVQRLFLGNLRTGKHQLAAIFTGREPQPGSDTREARRDNKRDFKSTAQLDFEKAAEPRVVELRIRDKQDKLQPEFEVKVWP
jgi:hypothetical protein